MASPVHSVQIDQLLQELRQLDVVNNVPLISSNAVGVRYEFAGALSEGGLLGGEGYLRGLENVDINFHVIYSVVVKARALLEQGDELVNMMYTMRSCSRALGKVDLQPDKDSTDVALKVFNILRPEMSKLSALNEFQERLTTFVSAEVVATMLELRELKLPVLDCQNEIFELLLDLIIRLDSVKDMKASILNDFAFYKRAFYTARASLEKTSNVDEIAAEIQSLQVFLADPRCPKSKLLSSLSAKLFKKQEGRSPEKTLLILTEVFQWCIRQLESESFVLPEEKWKLLRTLPYILLLVSDEKLNHVVGNPEILNVFKNKRIITSSFIKLYRRTPVVPLLCDMHVNLFYTLSQCSHFDAFSTVCQNFKIDLEDPQLQKRYALKTYWHTVRKDHEAFISKFSPFITKVELLCGGDASKLGSVPADIAANAIRLCEDGMRMLSRWKEVVVAQCAYKYAVPSTASANENEYERVVKENYSTSELLILIEFTARIKSMISTMLRAESILAPLLRIGIHSRVQSFVQNQMMEVLHRTEKKKRKTKAKTVEQLLHIRRLAADWLTDAEPSALQDYITKPKHRASRLTFRQRAVGLSLQQLHVMRMLVDSVCENSKKKALFAGADIDKGDIEILRSFYEDSTIYPYLLDLSGVLKSLGDLSALYYREFYMEMAKCVQFPIAMSLPWIMIREVIENPSSKALSCVLYALDVYNDAAEFALYRLKRKFVYDEIEAEANLVLEQFVFLLAEHIYSYYKARAASSLLDTDFKARMHHAKNSSFLDVEPVRYNVLMRQRHVEILGRSVDLALATSEQINAKLEQDIEKTISRFEQQDLTCIQELESQLEVLRECRDMLVEILAVGDFDAVFAKCDWRTKGSRVESHVLKELLLTVFRGSVFDHAALRFVTKSGRQKRHTGGSKPSVATVFGAQHSRAYELIHKRRRGFIDSEHVAAIVTFVSPSKLLLAVDSFLASVLEDEVKIIVGAVVAESKPSQVLKTEDFAKAFQQYKAQHKHFLDFDDISTMFSQVESLGNGLSFLYLVQSAATFNDLHSSLSVLPLLANSLDVYQCNALGPVEALASTSPLYHSLDGLEETKVERAYIKAVVEQHVAQEKESKHVFQRGIRTFRNSLLSLNAKLMEGQLTHTWYAIKFLICLSTEADQNAFGDGLAWAGAMLEMVLDSGTSVERNMDYVEKLLEVSNPSENTTTGSKASPPDRDLEEFVHRATFYQSVSRQVKAMLTPALQDEART